MQASGARKRTKTSAIISIAVIVVAIISLIALLIFSQPRNKYIDNDVLSVLNEYQVGLYQAQDFLLKYPGNDDYIKDFFSDDMKEYVHYILGRVLLFFDQIKDYDIGLIKNSNAKNSFSELRMFVSEDLPMYENALGLYDIFYDYFNHNFDEAIRQEIISRYAGGSTLIGQIDSWDELLYQYVPGEFIKQMFSMVVDRSRDYADYYGLASSAIANLIDFGVVDE